MTIDNFTSNVTDFKLKQENRDHKKRITSMCLTKGGKLVTSSDDETIRIFNRNSLKCEKIFERKKGFIYFVSVLDNGYLIASYKNLIEIIDISKDYDYVVQSISEQIGVIFMAVQISNSRVCSCSSDGSVRIWDSKIPFKNIKVKYTNQIYMLLLELRNKESIVFASESKISLFDAKSLTKKMASRKINISVDSTIIETKSNKLIVGGFSVNNDSSLFVLDSNDLTIETTILLEKESDEIWFLLDFGNDNVFFGDYKGYLHQLDLNELKISPNKKQIHSSGITGLLKVSDKNFLSCCCNPSIKLWEL